MRTILNLAGALFLFVGCTFFLQGIGVLPGSFMTGQTKWAYYGAGLVVVGALFLIRANRLRA